MHICLNGTRLKARMVKLNSSGKKLSDHRGSDTFHSGKSSEEGHRH